MPQSTKFHRRHGREGSALIIALLVSVILIILVSALLSTRVTELQAISSTVRSTNAQLIAEAGVDYVLGLVARDELELPATLPYYEVSGTFADGTFDVVADRHPTTGQFRVTSRGAEARGTRRTVEVLFDIASTNRIVDDYGLFTCGDLTLSGSSSVINGDVYAGGDLAIGRADAVSNGDITAYGNITFVSGSASVTGSATSETGSVTAPEGTAPANGSMATSSTRKASTR